MTFLDSRFWSKVRWTETCWLWIAGTTEKGYGQFWYDGKMRRAHRLAWEDVNGTIPDGLEIDHLCGVRACVRPSHLEAVDHRENVNRSSLHKWIAAINLASGGRAEELAARMECPQGHPYDEHNTYRNGGRRHCRECGRQRSRTWKQRRRELV